jgi:hypothetical protein
MSGTSMSGASPHAGLVAAADVRACILVVCGLTCAQLRAAHEGALET